MLVDDFREERSSNWVTVSARITWEQREHPPQRVRFEVAKGLADDVECSANAFFAATAVPAMYYGERRLKIDGEICPVLHDGLLSVLTQLREWYGTRLVLPEIETSQGFVVRRPRVPGRAAQFFSGGIDALTTLRRNRWFYPADHPSSIRDCLNVFGMHPDDYHGSDPNPARVELWDRNLKRLQAITDVAGVELYQLRTNVVGLFPDQDLLAWQYHSAIMLALVHLLNRRISEAYLASSDYLGVLDRWGSHPLIDPFYGSSAVRIRHVGLRLTRLDKVRIVSEWPEALAMLNVCSSYTVPQEGMNCGVCAKCVRTMLELLICGKLDQAPTFPIHQVTPESLKVVTIRTLGMAGIFMECPDPLREMGRHDLAEAVEEKLRDYYGWKRRKEGRGFKQKLKKLDGRLLGGGLRNTWRWLHKKNVGVSSH